MTNYVKNRIERSKDFDKKKHETKDHSFNPMTMRRVPHPTIKATWIEKKLSRNEILWNLLEPINSAASIMAFEMYCDGESIDSIDKALINVRIPCSKEEYKQVLSIVKQVNSMEL